MENTEQTVEDTVSVEDKIGNLFAGPQEQPEEAAAPDSQDVQAEGDEPTEDAEEQAASEDSEEESEYVEVEFDGRSYQVPPELKDALMRESDYTQKTQQLSSQRKEIELQQKEIVLAREQEAFNQSVKEDISQLDMLDAYIKHVNQNTNWAEMDVNDAFKAKMELDQLKEQKQALQEQLQQKYQQHKEEVDKRRNELRAESDKVLSGAIPNWSEKTKSDVKSYIKGLGYPELNIENMSSLDYQVAYKAMQFDALKSKTGEAVKKASTAPAIKPTARKEMPKDVRNKLNYRNKVKAAKDPTVQQKLAEDRIGQIFGG